MVNTRFAINRGFLIGMDGNNELTSEKLDLDLDELRVWQFARRTDDVLRTMTVRNKGYIHGLILYCGFDEGQGNITNATLYTLAIQATPTGHHHLGNNTGGVKLFFELKPPDEAPPWQPSGAPYPNTGN